jgi:hypothetical protein
MRREKKTLNIKRGREEKMKLVPPLQNPYMASAPRWFNP